LNPNEASNLFFLLFTNNSVLPEVKENELKEVILALRKDNERFFYNFINVSLSKEKYDAVTESELIIKQMALKTEKQVRPKGMF
jgi:hypothetical protein